MTTGPASHPKRSPKNLPEVRTLTQLDILTLSIFRKRLTTTRLRNLFLPYVPDVYVCAHLAVIYATACSPDIEGNSLWINLIWLQFPG